jgi:hypothetical protein
MTSVQLSARWLMAPGLALLLGACAATRLNNVGPMDSGAPFPAPRTVAIVTELALAPPRHETAESQQASAVTVARALQSGLAQALATHGLTVVDAGAVPDVVLRCKIVDVRSGKKALRLFVGYGAGKAELRVDVALERPGLSPVRQLLTFESASSSGSMPGGGLIGPALGSLSDDGLQKEARDTTNLIDRQLAQYFQARQWPYPTTKPAGSAR